MNPVFLVGVDVALGHVGFDLSTQRRAAQRADWDKWKEEKEKKETEERMERDRRLQKEMEVETKRLRQLTVHKAQPVPHFLKSKQNRLPRDKENVTGSRQNVKQ
jgi:Targeting protein for Xklp2 (TPX2) domain